MEEPPIRIENPTQPADKNFKRREFLLDIQDLPDKSPGYAAEVIPGTATNIPKQLLWLKKQQFTNGSRGTLAFEAAVPASSEILTVVRCGVATGPWKYSSSPSVNFSGTSISGGGSMRRSDEIRRNVSLEGHETEEGVVAKVSEDWFDKDDLRLVAITYDDRAVTGRSQIDHPQKEKTLTTITTTLPGLTLKEIKNLNVERRPFDWVCFDYVTAQPVAGESQKPTTSDTHDVDSAARRMGCGWPDNRWKGCH